MQSRWWMISLLVLLLWPSWARADYAWVVQGGLRFQYQKSPFLIEDGAPQPEQSFTGGSLLLGILGAFQLSDSIGLGWQLDLGELAIGSHGLKDGSKTLVLLNDLRIEDDLNTAAYNNRDLLLEESLLIRELYLRFSLHKRGWHKLDVGIRHLRMGEGFVFDGYALGFFLEADLRRRVYSYRKPLKLRFMAFLPSASFTAEGKLSPTAAVELLVDGKFLQLKGFVSYMFDAGGLSARIHWHGLRARSQSFKDLRLNPACQLRALRCNAMPSSSGHHLWGGLSFRGGVENDRNGFRVKASVFAYGGFFKVDLPELQDTSGFGLAGEIGLQYTLLRGVIGFKLFGQAGSDPEASADSGLAGFRSITPQLRHQHIMFNGGLNQASAKRTLGMVSLSDGFWGMLFYLKYEGEDFDFLATAGGYSSDLNIPLKQAQSDNTPTALDFELNVVGKYTFNRYLRLILQADLLVPGAYSVDRSRAVVFRLWTGLDFSLSSWR